MRGNGAADELGGREFPLRLDLVQQVMGNTPPLRHWNLGGPDIEPAIDLESVEAHHFAAQALRETEGEIALARARRPDDRNDRPLRSLAPPFGFHESPGEPAEEEKTRDEKTQDHRAVDLRRGETWPLAHPRSRVCISRNNWMRWVSWDAPRVRFTASSSE